MITLKRFILVFFILFAAATAVVAKPSGAFSVTPPDFAFPKKVAKDAKQRLSKALRSGDDVGALRALIDLAIAEGSIDLDRAQQAYATVERSATEMRSDAARALVRLLQAAILNEFYTNISSEFDERHTPIEPLPENWNEWSAGQFKKEICRLINEALRNEKALIDAPTMDFAAVLKVDPVDAIYFPSLFDIVSYQAISLLEDFDDADDDFDAQILPPAMIQQVADANIHPLTTRKSESIRNVLSLYSGLIRVNSGRRMAPYVHATVEALKFVADRVTPSTDECLDPDELMQQELLRLFEKYESTSEYAGEYLIALLHSRSTISMSKIDDTLFRRAKAFVERYPSYCHVGCLKREINDMLKPCVHLEFMPIVEPAMVFTVNASITNSPDIYIKIFRLKQSSYSQEEMWIVDSDSPVAQQHIRVDEELPFTVNRAVEFILDRPGRYHITVSHSNDEQPLKSITAISSNLLCTSVGLSSVNGDKSWIYSFNPATGVPLPNVDLYYINSKSKERIDFGTTNQSGVFVFANNDKNASRRIFPLTTEDEYGLFTNISHVVNGDEQPYLKTICFTDLPLYHPGDSIGWETIVYQNSTVKENNKTVSGLKMTAYLKNINRQIVDSADVVTDDFGRVSGRFYIPKGELTGNYSITFEIVGAFSSQTQKQLDGTRVKISDYKLPTFRIETEKPIMNKPANRDVTITGRIVAYSGFGITNSTVKLSLRAVDRERVYYSRRTKTFYTDSITSGEGGCFSFEIPSHTLDEYDLPKGYFVGTLIVTSPSGETQTQNIEFTRENFFIVHADLVNTPYMLTYMDNVYDNSKPIDINVTVLDAYRKETDLDVRLNVMNSDDETIYSLIVPAGKSSVNISSVSPGTYRIGFELADSALRELSFGCSDNYTLFKPDSDISPSSNPIWACMLKENKELKRGQKAKFYYAVPTNNSYFIFTLSSLEKVYSTQWMKADAGVHEMEVTLPEGAENARVSFQAFRDFLANTYEFDITMAKETLELKCESFRDKLLPGQTETWTFHTVNADVSPLKSALAMRMFSDQLNALYQTSFGGTFDRPNRGNIWISPSRLRNVVTRGFFQHLGNSNFIYPSSEISCSYYIFPPEFNTYGQLLVDDFPNLSFKKSGSSVELVVTGDEKVSEPPKNQSTIVTAMGIRRSDNDYNDDGVSYDLARVERTNTYSVTTSSPQPLVSVAEYRENISPLAFFCPSMTTGDNGELTFSFTVPNANTTWKFDAFAFTQDLLSAKLSHTMVANKPVMVSPNLPRFLRSGDRANIVSLVMNNSEVEQSVVTITELFDPISGIIIAHSTSKSTIPANQNISLTMVIDVPADASTAIGFRIKSATSDFSDGEQSLIPVLPSSQPVIETVPFYTSPDSARLSLQLPKIDKDARVTLQYCDNPTWYVATALPSLRKGNMITAENAADAIFYATTARGILDQHTVMAEAFRRWTESDKSDSTLVSMLQRNADLKTMLINATPWMVDAMNDTERMQRLALLFDPKEIEATCADAIALLQRLQRSSGGWAWMSKIDEASVWTTLNCLITLGRLNELGYLPKDKALVKMTHEALAWLEKMTIDEYKKYPKESYLEYTLTLDMWPDFRRSLTSDKIVKSEIQRVIKSWKSFPVVKKAICAVFLAHNGYSKLAETMLSSVFEFSKQTPEQGMWWPTVDEAFGGSTTELFGAASILRAVNAIAPNSKTIDSIRQWLILQKEARNWGTGSATTDIIQAILSTSPSWIEHAGSVEIRLDNRQIPVPYSEEALGYFYTDISSLNPSDKTLTICKSSKTPSWGTVYAHSTRTISEIKALSCDDVSIEKRLFVLRDNQWREANDLQVGDRVKIQLLIHANRSMQYVTIDDNRAACFEPVEQLPTPIYSQGLCFYRENRDSATNLFVTNMPKGTYMLEYEMFVNNSGKFSSGIATIQSQYAPGLTAHSSGSFISVSEQ